MEMEFLPPSSLDKKIGTTEDDYREEEEKKYEKTLPEDNIFARLSNDMHQQLFISGGPSSRVAVRPKLRSTKSFPPYSQCIGGLEGRLDPDPCVADKSDLRPEEVTTEERSEDVQERSSERKADQAVTTREKLKAKWAGRRRERSWVSAEADVEGWERRERWSGKRRMKTAAGEGECDTEEGEEGKGEGEAGRTLSCETEREDGEEEERKSLVDSQTARGSEGGGVKKPRKSEEDERTPGKRERSTNQWSSPHPILSKLLHSSSSSSTSSSSSSINLSSAESDEVFSEGEDASSKRKTFRKWHSWKTFLTVMHWSMQRQSSWVQLAGHQGNFQLSEGGEVLKLYSKVEAICLDCLMRDPLRPFVPQYHGVITRGGHSYIRLEDLLSGLKRPVIMDCKMGVRTYQEEELTKARTKPTLRSDMYQKMVTVDPSAPSAEEHAQKGVTKWRYLQWRDTTSSTATLGFRIEGIMMEDGSVQRDFRNKLTVSQVTDALLFFTSSQPDVLKAYHSRLQALSDALKESPFFRTHEVIGSSLLFVHDHSSKASVWMIDFGKTTPVPDTSELRHNVPWAEGSREDGYLIGLASLISSLNRAIALTSWRQEKSPEGKKTVLTEVD